MIRIRLILVSLLLSGITAYAQTGVQYSRHSVLGIRTGNEKETVRRLYTHSVAVGMGYTRNSYSRDWTGNPDIIKFGNDRPKALVENANYWLAYYYRNSFSIRFNVADVEQSAYSFTPHNGLYGSGHDGRYSASRNGYFHDLTVGYNLLRNMSKDISGWIYAGAGLNSGALTKGIHPVAQAQLKYNPIHFFFIGIGGSCRYVQSDYQQFAATLSAGIQI